MFRFETVVGLVVALMMSASSSFALTPAEAKKLAKELKKQENAGGESAAEVQQRKWDENCTSEKPPAYCAKLEAALGMNSDGGTECPSSFVTDYKKARDEFFSACSEAGYPASGISPKFPGCTYQIAQCRKCGRNDTSGAAATDGVSCDDFEGTETDSSTASDGSPIHNLGQMERKAHFCPSISAKSQKDLSKQYEDARKEIKELDKKIAEKEEKQTDSLGKSEDEASKANDDAAKAQQELDQGLSEARKNLKQANQQIADKILQLAAQIAAADDSIRQLGLKKAEVEVAYTEAIQQIELNCHASAIAEVSKRQQIAMSKPRNRGSFNDMLKNVGLSDREAWQREAAVFYKRCKNSPPTLASKKSAMRSRNVALDTANSNISKLQADKERLFAQQAKLRSGVCTPTPAGAELSGMDSGDSESCAAVKEAQAEANRLLRKNAIDQNLAQSKVQKAQNKAMREHGTKAAELAKLKAERAGEKKRLENLRRAHEIADAAASKSSDDPKANQNAVAKEAAFRTAAQTFLTCTKKTGACNSTDCKNAELWLGDVTPNIDNKSSELSVVREESEEVSRKIYPGGQSGEELTNKLQNELKGTAR